MSKKSCWKLIPVNGYDISAIERYLERMAAQGLLFSMTAGPLTFFRREEPKALQFHLEPMLGKAEEDPELNALYEDAGWQYLGMFRNNYFVFVTENLEAKAHTDPEALDYVLKCFSKQKRLSGLGLLALNFFLLSLYHRGWPGGIGWVYLQYFPVETISKYPVLPLLLSVLGLVLLDLSYLLGLLCLRRCRTGKSAGRVSRSGWLLAAGILVLIPVVLNTTQLFSGLDYRPYDLADSSFVTLSEIEGPEFHLTGDYMNNMDYISHGGTLLDPENWYFRQYGAYSHFDGGIDMGDVPHLILSITRYPMDALAEKRVQEWCTYRAGEENYQNLAPVDGLDEIYLLRDGEISYLVLRRGGTVLRADYQGDKDLSEFLERFAQMLQDL
ncbi:MAG: DUF2812 domain-containing protein [Oscillospiraceae bacterium]